MITRVAAASLAVLLLAGCGGSGYDDEPEPVKNTNPHHGWVDIGGDFSYRCVGVDKVIRHDEPYNDDTYRIETIKDSEDCL